MTFIYDLTQLFVAPFHGIFNTAANGRNVFEPESVVAIVIYLLIGWGSPAWSGSSPRAVRPEPSH